MAGYKVIAVEDRIMPGPGGTFAVHTVVRFRTEQGYTGEVAFEKGDVSVEAVRTAIEREVSRVDAIYSLGA